MKTGPRVKNLNFSAEGKRVFRDVESIHLDIETGVVEDCHDGKGDFQVSLFEGESDFFRENAGEKYGVKGFCIEKFIENITTCEVEYGRLSKGDRLQIGSALIEITKIGKKCYDNCPMKKAAGKCRMAGSCAFAKVVKAGRVKKGSGIKVISKFDD